MGKKIVDILNMSLAGSSREILHKRFALEEEINRTTHYLCQIRLATKIDQKLYFMRRFFEYLCNNTIRISQHVGFRNFILNQITHVKQMAWKQRYAAYPHVKQLLEAIRDVEKIIRETHVQGAL